MHLHAVIQALLLGASIFMMVKAAHDEAYSLPLFGELAQKSMAEDCAAANPDAERSGHGAGVSCLRFSGRAPKNTAGWDLVVARDPHTAEAKRRCQA